jgi:hypothetical protein
MLTANLPLCLYAKMSSCQLTDFWYILAQLGISDLSRTGVIGMAKKSAKPVNEEYISIRDAAALLGVYEKTISNWFDKGIVTGKRTVLGTRRPSRASILKIKARLDSGWRPRDG